MNDQQPTQQNTSVDTEKLQQELASTKDQLIRCQADFDNFSKRTIKERAQWKEEAQAQVLINLLPIVDDFERACAAVGTENPNQLEQGVLMIQKRLQKMLEQLKVQAIPYTKEFDPAQMQAVMTVESADHASGEVVAIIQQGYTFKGAVLRPAMVSVAQ